jgi:hypothetical protein
MDYKNLKDAIKAVIKKNGAQEITGQIMQDTLLSIVSKLGGNKTFAGVASPTTVPDTTDANIFYIAGENGTYVNFGGAKVENEAAVFVQVSGGTWRAIYTGIQTSHGVNNQLQQEHEYFETEIDKVSADLTQFQQTEFSNVKEDVERHTTEIAKNKSDITKINGEIATLNEASNTAADELVRIEGKVDANLKDAVVVFLPSTNTGDYKGADILSFTNDTPKSTVTAYMSQYWDKLVKLASGKISGSVYAESNNANCTGGYCIGGTQFGYLKIEIEDYQKGGLALAGEVLVLSFDSGVERKEMKFSKSGSNISAKVNTYKNAKGIDNYIVDCSKCNLAEGNFWTENATLFPESVYDSIAVDVVGVKKIVVRAYISGNARILLVDRGSKVLNTYNYFNNKCAEREIDLTYYKKTAYKLLICNNWVLCSNFKAVITEFHEEYNNIIRSAAAEIYNIDAVAKENAGGYNIDGTRNNNLPGFFKHVYACKSVKSFFVNSVMDSPEVASIVGISNPLAESGVVIERGVVGGARIVNIPEEYNYVAITFKSLAQFSIFEPRGDVYTLLSELMNNKGSLALLGDGLSSRNNIAYYKLNSGEIKGVGEYIAERYKLNVSNENYDFATLTDCKTKSAPDLNCVLTDDAIISMSDKKPNYILIWYGINDVTYGPIMQRELWFKDKYKADIAYPMQESEIGKDGYATAEQKAEVDKVVGRVGEVDYDNADSYFFAKFVGTENDEGLTTWCGALNYAFPLLMSEYPEAKILIICPDHEKHGKLIREATIKMAEKWGVLYFDLNSLPYWYGSEKTKFENTQHEGMSWLLASGETAAPTVEGFNKSRYNYDGIRPSDLGHKVISFPIGNKLING